MCIICNCGDIGDEFLCEFGRARASMKSAANWMLKCSQVAKTPEQRKSYDATYKRMVRLMSDWNRLEQQREHSAATEPRR
jgi:hypothetical protein